MKNLEYYTKGIFDKNGTWIIFVRNKGYNLSAKSLGNKKSLLEHYVIPFWGKYKPDEITIKRINSKLFNAISVRTGLPLSYSTKNRILYVLSSILNYLIEEDILENNIIHKMRKFNTAPQNPRGVILDFDLMRLYPENHEELLKIWRDQLFVCAFLIMRDTGMRNNEILGLKWGDWYKELRVITVLRAIESGTKDKENDTKTGHPRVALLSDLATKELAIFKSQRLAHPDAYIFSRKDKRPIFGQRLTTAFHQAVKRAGINRPDYTPYWLRHTFDTNLLDNYPYDIARRLMGHTNLETTLEYRSRNIESLLKEAQYMKMVQSLGNGVSLLQMILVQRQMEQALTEGGKKKPHKIKHIPYWNFFMCDRQNSI